MQFPFLAALAATALLTQDLDAQRRGRFTRGGQGGEQAPPSAETKTEETKSDKPKAHLAIVGGDVYLGTGQRITGATVLVGDDKILAVGHNLELPEGTTVIDAKGKTVSPGFVCVYGAGMGAGRSAPYVDSCNPFDPEIKQGLGAGITSFLVNAPRGGSVPSGEGAVVKLAYGKVEDMVLQEGTVLGMSGQLSPQDREKFRDLVKQAKEHQRALAEFLAKKADDPQAKAPKAPAGTEKILDVLNGKSKLWLSLASGGFNPFGGGRTGSASDVDAIRSALSIAEELGVGCVLVKPTSAWLLPDEIAATDSMVIISPRDRLPAEPTDPDRTGSNLASAALLHKAGVPVAVTCPVGMFGGAGVGTNGILGQDLNTPNVDAAFAVRGGMPNSDALRTLTLDAAKILGVDHRVGSLEKGKDADILILDADPLHYRSFVETAIVSGRVVYEIGKEPIYSRVHRQGNK